jgi:hypothetical protein
MPFCLMTSRLMAFCLLLMSVLSVCVTSLNVTVAFLLCNIFVLILDKFQIVDQIKCFSINRLRVSRRNYCRRKAFRRNVTLPTGQKSHQFDVWLTLDQ